MPKATRKQLDAAEKLLRANGYLTYELLERDKEEREVAAVYRQQARSEFHDEGTIEIDDLAPVSVSEDGGAYVMAWVWVRNDDDSEDEDEDPEDCDECGAVLLGGGACHYCDRLDKDGE